MKLKNTMPRNFKNLLWNSLREKRNWFVLSAVILAVTVIIIPLLMERDVSEENIVIGIVEVFIIVFINILLDLSYLHNYRKFTYYQSKPITNMQMIDIVIVSNLIFAMFFMSILYVISAMFGFDLLSLFVVPIAWMVIGIFLAPLSSLLAGNIVIAGIATIFNFAIPVSLLGVIYFGVSIVENIALGFSADIIMEKLIDTFYRIDYLYFIKLVDEPNWLIFSVLLFTICFILYFITTKLSVGRKNERIGDQIVFTGYKNFVALIVTTLIPLAFSSALYNNDYVAKLISFVILGSITFYVTIAIFEKSFIIDKSAFKLLAAFMALFILFISITGVVVRRYESYIPESEEIVAAFINGSDYIYIDDKRDIDGISDLDLEIAKKYDQINIFTSKESIEAIRSIQKSVIENQKYRNYGEVHIVYFLKNGDKLSRYYRLLYDYSYEEDIDIEEVNADLDKYAQVLEDTDDYRNQALRFIYDDDFSRNWKMTEVEINSEGNDKLYLNSDELYELRMRLKQDLEVNMNKEENSLSMVLRQDIGAYFDYYYYEKVNTVEREVHVPSFSIRIKYGSEYDRYLNMSNQNKNTSEYILMLIDNK